MNLKRIFTDPDIGLLVFRLGFGLGFLFFHGWGKLTGGPETWTQVGGAVEVFGIGFGHTVFGFIAAFAESVGGLMIALGLFYRPFCDLLALTMFTAAVMHIATGQGSPNHAVKNVFVAFGARFIGPGKYSLDVILRKKNLGLRG